MKRILIGILLMLLLVSLTCAMPMGALAETPQGGAEAPAAETEPVAPPVPEEPEYEPLPEAYLALHERVRGDWYADKAGLVITLELAEDSYTLSVPGGEPLTGRWEVRDEMIVLGGDEENVLLPLVDVIRFDALNLLFTREQPITYVPAEVFADAIEGNFDGFFRAQFVAVGEGTILAAAVREDAFVYIKGANVALGGARFGNVIKVFTAAPGALTLDEDGLSVRLELQRDGFLRMTLPNAVIYLMSAPDPFEKNEAAAEE